MGKTPNISLPLSALPEVTISAGEMARALKVIAYKLNEWHLIDQESFSVLLGESSRLQRDRDATSWSLDIDRDNPVTFAESKDKNGNVIIPRLVCKGISVAQDQHELPPFLALDIAIEIDNVKREPVARWHVDLANEKESEMQPGPLVHLQYGGHNKGYRDKDHPLKEPRWCHPPMEVILLSEVVVANFHPEFWEELREDANWCDAISVGQKLCYTTYLRKMLNGLSISSKTLLHSMWASHWTAAA